MGHIAFPLEQAVSKPSNLQAELAEYSRKQQRKRSHSKNARLPPRAPLRALERTSNSAPLVMTMKPSPIPFLSNMNVVRKKRSVKRPAYFINNGVNKPSTTTCLTNKEINSELEVISRIETERPSQKRKEFELANWTFGKDQRNLQMSMDRAHKIENKKMTGKEGPPYQISPFCLGNITNRPLIPSRPGSRRLQRAQRNPNNLTVMGITGISDSQRSNKIVDLGVDKENHPNMSNLQIKHNYKRKCEMQHSIGFDFWEENSIKLSSNCNVFGESKISKRLMNQTSQPKARKNSFRITGEQRSAISKLFGDKSSHIGGFLKKKCGANNSTRICTTAKNISGRKPIVGEQIPMNVFR